MKKRKTERIVFCSSKKVVLRPIMKKDIRKLLIWMNDQEIMRYISRSMPLYEKEEEEWIENLHKRKETDLLFAIETKGGVFIGTIGLHKTSWKDRVSNIGIVIGEKKYWGKSFGTEAIMLLLEYVFNTLNLRKVCLSVFNFNKRAYKCYCKCGFRVEGRRQKQYYKNGRYFDEVMMAVFKKDWLDAKKEKC